MMAKWKLDILKLAKIDSNWSSDHKQDGSVQVCRLFTEQE